MVAGQDRRNRGRHAAAHAAQRLILEQHRELRRLLALGLVQTYLPSHDRKSASAALRALVEGIRSAFMNHVSDEEAALLSVFDGDVAGSRRAQILREEHGRQRLEIEALHALSTTEDAHAFTERYDGLARALLVDIAEEERALAFAVALLDGRIARASDYVQRPSIEGQHHGSRASRAASTATG